MSVHNFHATGVVYLVYNIIKRDYSGMSGLMMERYFMKKFQEEGRYIVGKWWDTNGPGRWCPT